MKIFIAGPITGVAGYAEKFNQAEEHLTAKGHHVLNPAVLPYGFEHSEYMEITKSMLNLCDAIYLLKGWEKSPGAKEELALALDLGKWIYPEG